MVTEADLHRVRTEADLRGALHAFCEAAWTPTARVPIFSIPPQPRDADMILSDGIDELVAARAEIARLRAGIAELRMDHRDCYDPAGHAEDDPAYACECGANPHNAKIAVLLVDPASGGRTQTSEAL